MSHLKTVSWKWQLKRWTIACRQKENFMTGFSQLKGWGFLYQLFAKHSCGKFRHCHIIAQGFQWKGTSVLAAFTLWWLGGRWWQHATGRGKEGRGTSSVKASFKSAWLLKSLIMVVVLVLVNHGLCFEKGGSQQLCQSFIQISRIFLFYGYHQLLLNFRRWFSGGGCFWATSLPFSGVVTSSTTTVTRWRTTSVDLWALPSW